MIGVRSREGLWFRRPLKIHKSQFSVLSSRFSVDYFFDGGAKVRIGHGARVVEGDVAGAVEQHQGRGSAGPVKIKVFLAYRDGHILQSRIEVLPDAFDVGQFVLGLGVFPCAA